MIYWLEKQLFACPAMKAAAHPVDLATPNQAGEMALCPSTPQGQVNAEADINDSPRLPSDWSPLEYELLEYADSLPAGFAERIARELEGQQQRVAQLRSLNSLMLHVLHCEVPSMAPGAPAKDSKENARAALAVPKAWQENPSAARVAPNNQDESASRRLVLASASRQLEMQVLEVRRAAEQELFDLANRARSAEEKNWRLRREQSTEDALGRKKLWEAEAKLNKLQNRIQQLEVRRRNLARKSVQRDEEVKQLKDSNAQMQAEILNYRTRTKEFDAADHLEEELRCQVRELRSLRSGAKVVFQNDLSRQASPCRVHALVMGSPSPLRRAGDRRG